MITKKRQNESETFDLMSYLNDEWARLSKIVGLKLHKMINGLSSDDVEDILIDAYVRISNRATYFEMPKAALASESSSKKVQGKSKTQIEILDASLVNWIATIAWRLALNNKRKYNRLSYVDPMLSLPVLMEKTNAHQNSFWDELVILEQVNFLKEKLTSEDWEIFDKLLQGYKHREISEELSLNQNTVHTRVYRMFSTIASLLKNF